MGKKEEVVTDAPKVLKAEVQALSDKIRNGGLEINKTDGVVTETKSNYDDNLPEGITSEVVEKISDYNTRFVAASAHAFGALSVEAMQKNKKLDVTSGELKLGPKDMVRHAMTRSKDYSFGSGNERKTVTKVGVLATEVDVKGGHNSGQLKVARQIVGLIATEKLSK